MAGVRTYTLLPGIHDYSGADAGIGGGAATAVTEPDAGVGGGAAVEVFETGDLLDKVNAMRDYWGLFAAFMDSAERKKVARSIMVTLRSVSAGGEADAAATETADGGSDGGSDADEVTSTTSLVTAILGSRGGLARSIPLTPVQMMELAAIAAKNEAVRDALVGNPALLNAIAKAFVPALYEYLTDWVERENSLRDIITLVERGITEAEVKIETLKATISAATRRKATAAKAAADAARAAGADGDEVTAEAVSDAITLVTDAENAVAEAVSAAAKAAALAAVTAIKEGSDVPAPTSSDGTAADSAAEELPPEEKARRAFNAEKTEKNARKYVDAVTAKAARDARERRKTNLEAIDRMAETHVSRVTKAGTAGTDTVHRTAREAAFELERVTHVTALVIEKARRDLMAKLSGIEYYKVERELKVEKMKANRERAMDLITKMNAALDVKDLKDALLKLIPDRDSLFRDYLSSGNERLRFVRDLLVCVRRVGGSKELGREILGKLRGTGAESSPATRIYKLIVEAYKYQLSENVKKDELKKANILRVFNYRERDWMRFVTQVPPVTVEGIEKEILGEEIVAAIDAQDPAAPAVARAGDRVIDVTMSEEAAADDGAGGGAAASASDPDEPGSTAAATTARGRATDEGDFVDSVEPVATSDGDDDLAAVADGGAGGGTSAGDEVLAAGTAVAVATVREREGLASRGDDRGGADEEAAVTREVGARRPE